MSNVLTLRKMLTLRIELVGSEPVIWRKLQIDDGTRLDEAGLAVQIVMGWEHAHMQAFTNQSPYAEPRSGAAINWYDEHMRAESGDGESLEDTTLGQALRVANDELYFEYDFGDGWIHRITVESRRELKSEDSKYLVLDGRLRAPLEDSGGLGGWHRKLEIYRSAQRSEDDENTVRWMEWRGGPWKAFDPETFDIDFANARLQLLAGSFVGANAAGQWAAQFHEGISQYLSLIFAHCQIELVPTGREIPTWFVELLKPFSTLVEMCTDQGITLTKAGWMPPTMIAELMTSCDLNGIDYERGKVKREIDLPTISTLRDVVTGLRLIRKYKGQLIATKLGNSLLQDPPAMADFILKSLRSAAMNDVQADATFSEWVLCAGGYNLDTFAKATTEGKSFVHVSEILENFGYWDPNRQAPISSDSYIPRTELWHAIGKLMDFKYSDSDSRQVIYDKRQQLSRFILEA
ncbi:plasmid pRiA4b ORF-3 family protein [Glutamicibacter arilaitensis]|uniref:plasmid pRiA4b ORF-3 family protein n=1 Tax=Glutamicibacter arilaitensis TaxID=256701 RepID=UPI00384C6F3C